MTIGAYMKEVAAQLRRAVVAEKRQNDETRAQIVQKETAMRQKIDSLKSEIKRKQSDLSSLSDQNSGSTILKDIVAMQQEVKETERQFNEDKIVLESQIREVESDMNDLTNKAGEFERRAATS